MIRRITIGQFQLKQQTDGSQHLFLQGKPIHPISERVKKLNKAERDKAAEVARWITSHSPFVDTYSTEFLNTYHTAEKHLETIYDELVRLNRVIEYMNEQIEYNRNVKSSKYTSVFYTFDRRMGETIFHLRHYKKLPTERIKMVSGVPTGVLFLFNQQNMKYVDLEEESDLAKLYGNYILVVKQ